MEPLLTTTAGALVAASFGSMLFFTAVVAPLIFTRLPEEVSGPFIREVFPGYYLALGLATGLATFAALDEQPGLALVCGGFVYARQGRDKHPAVVGPWHDPFPLNRVRALRPRPGFDRNPAREHPWPRRRGALAARRVVVALSRGLRVPHDQLHERYGSDRRAGRLHRRWQCGQGGLRPPDLRHRPAQIRARTRRAVRLSRAGEGLFETPWPPSGWRRPRDMR